MTINDRMKGSRMANQEVLREIQARERERARRLVRDLRDELDAHSPPRVALASTLSLLAEMWRADADLWETSGRKGWQSTSAQLRQCASRVAGVAVELENVSDDLLNTLDALEPLEPPAANQVAAGTDVPADSAGDDAAPVAAISEPAREGFLRGLADAYPLADVGTIDDTPGTSELNAEARAMTDLVFPISSSDDATDPFADPGPPTFSDPGMVEPFAGASSLRRSYADLITPPDAGLLPAHWSWSQIESSEDCGLRYRLQRIERIEQVPQWALIGGRVFHACVERIERENPKRLWPRLAVGALWLEQLHAEIEATRATTRVPFDRWRPSSKGREGYDWWRVEGSGLVSAYLDAMDKRLPHRTPVDVILDGVSTPILEKRLSMTVNGPLGDLKFDGILDQAWVLPDDSVLIVDLKSGARMPSSSAQIGTQAWLLRANGLSSSKPIMGSYYDARRGTFTPPVDVFAAHPWEEIIYRVHTAEAKRRAGAYSPHVSTFCGGCAVRYACPVVPS